MLEGHPSAACAAAAAVVQSTGDDDPKAAAQRIVEALYEAFEEEDDSTLARLRQQLGELEQEDDEPGLLGAWLAKVARDHERLVPYFGERTELTLLDRVYVQLQLGTGRHSRQDAKGEEALRSRGPWSLRDLLVLDAQEHAWISGRWVVLGDPGAGKTTLLRHLAASVAQQKPEPWVPVFESLSRLMREPEWLLDRIERQMKRAGEPAAGLAAVLDRAGQKGQLLLLLDGLDEVSRDRREEAEALLRQLSGRWPKTPLVVSSRPIGYRRPGSDFQELELLPFGREQRREFLGRWFCRESGEPRMQQAEQAAEILEQDAGLRDLASNPLYLTLMAMLIEQGTSPAGKRTDLYTQVFQLLLDGGYKYRSGSDLPETTRSHPALQPPRLVSRQTSTSAERGGNPLPPNLASQIPPPSNWQDFETLCCDLWMRIWDDPNTQQNGREGQLQFGVDIFGRPNRGTIWAGVQCKLRSQLKGSRLTARDICREVVKARDFNPRLAQFIVATSAERDAGAQAAAREITRVQEADDSFPVTVFAWDDIVPRLLEHQDVLEKHYPHLADGAAAQDRVRADYLSRLWAELYPVPLMGVGAANRREDIPLAAVYTALDTQSTETVFPGRQSGNFEGYRTHLEQRLRKEALAKEKATDKAPESYTRALTAVEIAAWHARLVLVGPAGSGKSTFARYLALCLAGEALSRPEANLATLESQTDGKAEGSELAAWTHGSPLPVFVELRRFVRSDGFPKKEETGTADHLLSYLEACGPEKIDNARMLKNAFASEGDALLILDGLDETPAATESRKRLKQVIVSFSRRFPHCRLLVTCRPYAYEAKSPWRLDSEDFIEESLRPFDQAKRGAFIEGWYQHLVKRRQVGGEQAKRASAALIDEIEASEYLKPLAERPLMLTMMTDLHAACGGRLPGGRAGLYERSVELLLDRWNEVRNVLGGKSLSEHLGVSDKQVRQALESLAYTVHRERGAETPGAAEITDVELWKALSAKRPQPAETRVDELQVRDYLHQRSGILIGESPERYRFPHRSFQEYLAACHLTRTSFPRLLLREVGADPALWREVTLLAAGKAESPFMAWALLGGLVPDTPPAEVAAADPRFLQALYAGLASEESELWREVEDEDKVKLERIRQWLERSLELGALSPVDRAAGGRVLALLGDQRRGVTLSADGVPDIDWVDVPAGDFRMGSSEEDDQTYNQEKPQHDVELEAFRIARYPVTNAQYQAFVDDGGYEQSCRECWSEAGWLWKGDRQGPDDNLPPKYLLPNHPRVNMSWFEADAFSRWLGRKLGAAIRLPSEAEWEKAARGTDGRIYPWGQDFDAARCNAWETGIRHTSAVGMFPTGASPYGVLDMSGNVFEWTLSEWSNDYKDREQGVEAPAAREEVERAKAARGVRVCRGGSCWNVARVARCAYRYRGEPRRAVGNLGFRVLLPAPRARG